MKRIFNLFALSLLFAVCASAQVTTKENTVYITAGTTHNERVADVEAGSATVSVNYIRTIKNGFGVDTTVTYTGDRLNNNGSGRTFNNTTFLEYYPTTTGRVMPFVGVGFSAQRFTARGIDGQASFNPAFEAGLDINAGKTQFEPYLQVTTPDLKQRARTNSIGGGINVYHNLTDGFGLRTSAFAADNRWRNAQGNRESGTTYGVTTGVFFTFD